MRMYVYIYIWYQDISIYIIRYTAIDIRTMTSSTPGSKLLLQASDFKIAGLGDSSTVIIRKSIKGVTSKNLQGQYHDWPPCRTMWILCSSRSLMISLQFHVGLAIHVIDMKIRACKNSYSSVPHAGLPRSAGKDQLFWMILNEGQSVTECDCLN